MAYFSNGSCGLDYMEVYCFQCQNYRDRGDGRGHGCAVMDAHTLHNYAECNKPDSILHILIPRKPNGENGECAMFLPPPAPEAVPFDAEAARRFVENERAARLRQLPTATATNCR